MKLAIRILPLLLLAAIAHATQTAQPASPPKQANTGSHFIVSLLQNAAKANSGNICLCPYSAAETITLLAPGAAPQTHLELESALGDLSPLIKAGKADSLYIESANRLYLDSRLPISPTYTTQLPDSSVTGIDFRSNPEQARTSINQWVETATHGLIGELLAPGQISPETTLAAINAFYIKDRWDNEFDEQHTADAPFTLTDGTTKQVPAMHLQTAFPCTITPEYSAVALPFVPKPIKGTHNLRPGAGMIFILPPEGMTIDTFVQSLTADKLTAIRRSLSSTPETSSIRTVLLSLPKFQMASETNLIPILKNMGLKAAFLPDHGFPRITTAQHPLPLDSFIQKCSIRIDEQGSEGAASTAMVATMGIRDGGSDDPVSFTINRPFVWLIVPSIDLAPLYSDHLPEQHNHPVFIGMVKEPHFPVTASPKNKPGRTTSTAHKSQKLSEPPRPKRIKMINAPMNTKDCDIPWGLGLELGTPLPPQPPH